MRTLFLVLALLNVPTKQATLVWVGPAQHRVVALTFDAGADRGRAALILQILERNHIHATFGMTGRWAQSNADLVKRIARDGDTFINHTYDHRSFTGLSTKTAPLTLAQRTWEITQTEKIVHRLTGKSMRPYFRPPYGDYDSATLTLARRLGYRYAVMWTIDSGGWEGLSPAVIEQRCLLQARPGAIILMHVGILSRDALALQTVITGLRKRHYGFVTVPALLNGS